MKGMPYTLCEIQAVPIRHRNRLARKKFPVTAERFREARLSCFLSVAACAELLHISVRTVRNWESGAVRPPYAAYKLMRVLRGGKLLGPEWQGFTIRAHKLHTPEGHTFEVGDLAWWSLLVRQAREFRNARRQVRALERAAAAAAASVDILLAGGVGSEGSTAGAMPAESVSIDPIYQRPPLFPQPRRWKGSGSDRCSLCPGSNTGQKESGVLA